MPSRVCGEERFWSQKTESIAELRFAIFVFFAATRRRGDFAAIVTLIALYVLIPAILDGLGVKAALPLFYPTPSNPVWLGPAVVWGEAMAAVIAAISRVALAEKRAL